MSKMRRTLPGLGLSVLVLIALGSLLVLSVWGLPLHRLVSLMQGAHLLVADNLIFAAPVFFLLYIVVLTSGFPGGSIFAAIGGYVFGIWLGSLMVLSGILLSAIVVRWLVDKSHWTLKQLPMQTLVDLLERGVVRQPFVFPLLVRAVPVFPFFWLNLGFALLRQPTGVYLITAMLGAFPSAIAVVALGYSVQVWLLPSDLSLVVLVSQPLFIVSVMGVLLLALAGFIWGRRHRV